MSICIRGHTQIPFRLACSPIRPRNHACEYCFSVLVSSSSLRSPRRITSQSSATGLLCVEFWSFIGLILSLRWRKPVNSGRYAPLIAPAGTTKRAVNQAVMFHFFFNLSTRNGTWAAIFPVLIFPITGVVPANRVKMQSVKAFSILHTFVNVAGFTRLYNVSAYSAFMAFSGFSNLV